MSEAVKVGIGAALVLVVVVLTAWKGWLTKDANTQKDNSIATFATCAQYSGEKLETCKEEEKDKPKTAKAVTEAINKSVQDRF